MEAFIQQVISGLVSGAIYASLALSLVMIFRSSGHLNFAQGEMAMFTTFICLSLIGWGLPYWVAVLVCLVLAFLIGSVLWSFVVKPIANVNLLSPIALLIGVMMIFNSLAGFIWGHDTQNFPSPFEFFSGWGSIYIADHDLGTILVILVVTIIVQLFFQFTKVGLAMRAAAENSTSSYLVGIPVGRMLSVGWGLATVLGTLAGVLVAPIIYVDPNMMLSALIYGFAAALLGGITSPLGAVFGGFIVGVAENLIGFYLIGTDIKMSVALILIIVTLLFKPAGIFGKEAAWRV